MYILYIVLYYILIIHSNSISIKQILMKQLFFIMENWSPPRMPITSTLQLLKAASTVFLVLINYTLMLCELFHMA